MNIRTQFPIFTQHPSLVYLDTAATAQKPAAVIEAMARFYTQDCANVHRGVYALAERATEQYEAVRAQVAQFIGAQTAEIVFTRSTTESINLVAQTWGVANVHAGDEVVITALEHHANLLPWQALCRAKEATLKVIDITPDGRVDMSAAAAVIGAKTKLVAAVHSSNFLGTHVDVAQLARMAHAVGAKILVDAAQSVVHETINVQNLDTDFLVFSGHKIYGPTGVGVLYGKKEILETMPPYEYGGGMVYEADYQHATWMPAPRRFEAGTPPIAQVIGLGAAITFLGSLNRAEVARSQSHLCAQLITELQQIDRITILGPVEELKTRGHLVSFVVDGIHPHDVAAYLDQSGICVRAGHHCAQPLAKRLQLASAVRASFGCYNNQDDVQKLCEQLGKLLK